MGRRRNTEYFHILPLYISRFVDLRVVKKHKTSSKMLRRRDMYDMIDRGVKDGHNFSIFVSLLITFTLTTEKRVQIEFDLCTPTIHVQLNDTVGWAKLLILLCYGHQKGFTAFTKRYGKWKCQKTEYRSKISLSSPKYIPCFVARHSTRNDSALSSHIYSTKINSVVEWEE